MALHPERGQTRTEIASFLEIIHTSAGQSRKQSMRLETDRLLLRPFQKSDLDDLAAFTSDEETMKFVSPPLTREQVSGIIDWFIAEWQRLGYGWFAVMNKRTKRLLGQCGLQCIEDEASSSTAELIFVIDRNAWGKGYATEAAGAVVKFGFETGGLEKIVAVTIIENAPSRNILKGLGFRYIDNRATHDHEVMYYELTRKTFESRQNKPTKRTME
jgi:RimJ/RimL family protein N-acetyltransferase